ncbi:MAG: ABC transporter permease, partial [Pseudomonadota bacterium]
MFGFRTALPRRTEIVLGLAGLAAFLGLWHVAAVSEWVKPQFLPTPMAVVEAFGRLFTERNFAADILISIGRVWLAFFLSVIVAVPLGVLMSCYRAVGAFV